ncbi:brct domain-containing protein [Colletotrichum chrysophilum]|uniref:Brct domain-containing protein n=1 Tax=Colletotrichum chrysophilum TaxID=1836956 RepID=A0AAD9AL35_9PEZI|nr:brct domain-containing protein [Colletotrichum chrysophilum]
MVAGIFKDRVLAAAGKNEHEVEKLQTWTQMRKGRFSLDMDDSVTHLLCTDEQLKNRNRNKRIQEAMQKNKVKDKKIKIKVVHIDWFTFSCTHNKKLRECDYDFKAIKRREDIKLRKRKEEEARIRNAMVGQDWINPDLYRVFSDKHHFRYEIQLFRDTEDEYGAVHEKYELYLFESHAEPRLYWFGAKLYQKKDDGVWRFRAIERTSATCGVFKTEFEHFKNFFEIKTKYRWGDRVLKAGTGEKTDFSYTPPTRGKPVGGILTPGLTYYDKCVKRNIETRLLFADLFGDELPANIQIDVAVTELLNEIIDKACAAHCEDPCDGVYEMRSTEVPAPAERGMPFESDHSEEEVSGGTISAPSDSMSQLSIEDIDDSLGSKQECEMEDATAPSVNEDERWPTNATPSEGLTMQDW